MVGTANRVLGVGGALKVTWNECQQLVGICIGSRYNPSLSQKGDWASFGHANTSVGTIIDYNRRLLGCLFHNDLSIMKLVIDNNRKIRHLAAKHETKKRQVVSFLAMKHKLQNTLKGSKSVPKCKKIISLTNHILVFRYQSK